MSPRFVGLSVALALAAVVIAGCSNGAALQAQSLAYQKAYCASKGKQFLWKDTKTQEGAFMRSVTAEGHCVGPGERGYEPPATDTEP